MQVLRDSNVNKKVAKRKLTKEEKKAKKAEYDKEYYLKKIAGYVHNSNIWQTNTMTLTIATIGKHFV